MFSHASTLCCRLVYQLLDFYSLFFNAQTAYWRQLDGKATRLYSAVGLLAAQRLQAVLRVPIGIIQVRLVLGFVAGSCKSPRLCCISGGRLQSRRQRRRWQHSGQQQRQPCSAPCEVPNRVPSP